MVSIMEQVQISYQVNYNALEKILARLLIILGKKMIIKNYNSSFL